MVYPKGMVLLAVWHGESGIEEAKKYIAANNLTSDDVKITARSDETLVTTKREVSFGQS